MIQRPEPGFLVPDKVKGKRLWGENMRSRDDCSYYAGYPILKVWKKKNSECFRGLWIKLKWLNLITQVLQVPVTVPETTFHSFLARHGHCRLLKLFPKKHLWVSILLPFSLFNSYIMNRLTASKT